MDPDKNLTPDATNHLTSESQPLSNPANAYQPQPAARLIVPSQPTSISMSPQKNSEYPQEVQPSSEAQSSIQSTNTMAYSYNTINASNPKRRIPRWLKMILGVAFVLIALFALAIGRYLSSFQAVTYKEKTGTIFSMKYFKGATLKPASDFVHSESDFQFRGSDFLVASSGKYPLAIQINLNNGDSLYAKNALCANPAFKLKQVGDGQSDVICHLLPGNQKEYLYMYEFKSGGNKYLVSMVQYIKAFDNPPTDADEVKELTDKLLGDSELDLRNFKDDLQIILPSIKVVN